MPTAHATPDLLAAYANGSLSEGMSLLVASHLALCAGCRSRVARLEAMCGALLRDCDAVAPNPACLAGAMARIEREGAAVPRPVAAGEATLPAPLRARVGVDLEGIRWRFVLPGLSECRLKGFEGEDVRLMRARPGVRILDHTHDGEEATLVLAGQLRDGERTLGRGDLGFAGETDAHHPEIIGSETCLCLVVLSGRMRFTGPVGRVLNLFV